jgi:hypothetical protein
VGNALTKLLLTVELLDRINFEILVNPAFQLSGCILISQLLPHGLVLLGRSLVNRPIDEIAVFVVTQHSLKFE